MAFSMGTAHQTAQRGALAPTMPGIASVRLCIEPVAYRSAAWDALWRRLFEAIAAQVGFAAEDAITEENGGAAC